MLRDYNQDKTPRLGTHPLVTMALEPHECLFSCRHRKICWLECTRDGRKRQQHNTGQKKKQSLRRADDTSITSGFGVLCALKGMRIAAWEAAPAGRSGMGRSCDAMPCTKDERDVLLSSPLWEAIHQGGRDQPREWEIFHKIHPGRLTTQSSSQP